LKKVRVGAVLPETYWNEEEWKNAAPALRYVDEAAKKNVQLLVFPEGYPGPMTGPILSKHLSYKPIDALREKAREHSLYVLAGDVEENLNLQDTYFLTLKLISPQGEILARYLRVQPDTPPLNAYLYNGKAHLLPGKEFKVVETSLGRIGLEICSELFVPEISRILMLRGAEILVSPVHGFHSKTMYGPLLWDTWRCMARARAAENLCYVIVTKNLYRIKGIDRKKQAEGGAFVAGPEKMIASRETPGLLVADLDMERLTYLRTRNYDEENLSRPNGKKKYPSLACRPGQIWERNPELFKELSEPHKYSFNYSYHTQGLDAWIEQYNNKIYEKTYTQIQKKHGKLQFQ
jgi:predicted amidohydrolase